jgi:hypothetical protein
MISSFWLLAFSFGLFRFGRLSTERCGTAEDSNLEPVSFDVILFYADSVMASS